MDRFSYMRAGRIMPAFVGQPVGAYRLSIDWKGLDMELVNP